MALPKSVFSNVEDINKTFTFPSYTYHIVDEDTRIAGHVDGIDAMAQACDLMLVIDRYQYDIFTDNYGIEINDLYGKEPNYVKAVIIKRIKDALSIDDRIVNLTDIKVELLDRGRKIHVTMWVETTEGSFEYTNELDLYRKLRNLDFSSGSNNEYIEDLENLKKEVLEG